MQRTLHPPTSDLFKYTQNIYKSWAIKGLNGCRVHSLHKGKIRNKKTTKIPSIWKLRNIIPNNPWIQKEITWKLENILNWMIKKNTIYISNMRFLDIGNPEANPQWKLHSMCFTIIHWTHHLEGHFSVCVLYFIINSVFKKYIESRTGKENKGLSTGQTLRISESSQANGLQMTGKPINAEAPDQQMTSSWEMVGWVSPSVWAQSSRASQGQLAGTCRRPQVQGLTSHCPTHHPAWHLFPSFILTTENGLFISVASNERQRKERDRSQLILYYHNKHRKTKKMPTKLTTFLSLLCLQNHIFLTSF